MKKKTANALDAYCSEATSVIRFIIEEAALDLPIGPLYAALSDLQAAISEEVEDEAE